MVIEKVGSVLPFTCEQIFDLAADVERYPDFLPWWVSAKVVSREPNRLKVDQVLGLGPANIRFESDAVLRRPERMLVTSADPRFREFRLEFTMSPQAPGGCTMGIKAQLALKSRFLNQLIGGALGASMDEIIASFRARALRLYGESERNAGSRQAGEASRPI
jgi:coenzyme Q-binding protein COQ10